MDYEDVDAMDVGYEHVKRGRGGHLRIKFVSSRFEHCSQQFHRALLRSDVRSSLIE